MAIFDIDGCEEKIGYSFKNKMLLRQCFTHASYANEHGLGRLGCNERLEFLGDAVLSAVVADKSVGVAYRKRRDFSVGVGGEHSAVAYRLSCWEGVNV